jgi:hypothetical protein
LGVGETVEEELAHALEMRLVGVPQALAARGRQHRVKAAGIVLASLTLDQAVALKLVDDVASDPFCNRLQLL